MDVFLDGTEVRILGCLVEKEMSTPEYYPLSLNALTNACNQKTNRNPVVSYGEEKVAAALAGLREKGFASETHSAGSRVPKYLHTVLDRFDLSRPEMAVLCELMLRGAQTPGELRSHCERMFSFGALEEVQTALEGLTEHDPPLAVKLPREAGRKEERYMHLFSGMTSAEEAGGGQTAGAPGGATLDELQEEIMRLRTDLEELRREFARFKEQF